MRVATMARFLALFFLLTLSSHLLGQEAALEIEIGGRPCQFKSLEKATVHAATNTGQLLASKLSAFDESKLKQIMEFTGWGRVWEDKTGKHRVVADLLKVNEKTISLEKTNGAVVTVEIEKLSSADQKYVRARKSSKRLPDHFWAKVIGVTDGDTITVLLAERQYKIRLSGIDAPETGQAFGTKAKKHLSKLVFGKHISGTTESVGKYGRNICTLTAEGKRVDLDLLKNGLAWHYLAYSNDSQRTAKEQLAKDAQINIWSESGPIPPWEWRRWGGAKRKAWLAEQEKKSSVAAPRGPPAYASPVVSNYTRSELKKPTNSKPALSYWLNTSSNIRHNPSCRWYHNTKRGRPCSADTGRGCKKCGG